MVEQDHAASKISLVLADVDGTLVTDSAGAGGRESNP